MIRNIEKLFLCCLFFFGIPTYAYAFPRNLPEAGWAEWIRLYPSELLLDAKLDTGADNCSLHAENIEEFAKDGEDWIRYKIRNRYGDTAVLEAKVIQFAMVKTKKDRSERRHVVRVGICLGNHFESLECNLVDRSRFAYPVLLGRSFLAGTVLINSSETYTTYPDCKKQPEKK